MGMTFFWWALLTPIGFAFIFKGNEFLQRILGLAIIIGVIADIIFTFGLFSIAVVL